MAQKGMTQDAGATPKDQKGESEGTAPSTDIVIPQRGEVTVPVVPDGFIEKIALELYGFTVTKCQQLTGYDDRNYRIWVSSASSNPHVTSVRPEGFVMKVMNSKDTRIPGFLHAQIDFMRHLGSHGIPTQEAVPSLKGENVVFFDFPSPTKEDDVRTHAICLRTFIPGSIYGSVTLTHNLCYKLGIFVATMTKVLEDFEHPFYKTFDHLWSLTNLPKLKEYVHVVTDDKKRHLVLDVIEQFSTKDFEHPFYKTFDHLWSLTNLPKLKEYVHVVTDDKKRHLVLDVIEQFSTKVLPRRNEIRRGYIHGDPNEQNILVLPVKSCTSCSGGGSDAKNGVEEYCISGILDFGGAGYTHPLYDLAQCITYATIMPVTFDPLEVGGHILAGYVSQMTLPEVERPLVRLCVAGRLVLSMVMGLYNYRLDPGNKYLLRTQKRGWQVLETLWAPPEGRVEEMWEEIQGSYQR